MQHCEGRFTGAGGLELYYQCWQPSSGLIKAAIGITPGLGSHSGAFERIVQPLIAAGYGVYGWDLRGHGQSPGQRGYVQHWKDFRDDTAQFWQLMIAENPAVPCFLMGHSLGALIVLDYTLHQPQPLPGIILMAPAIGPVGISPLKLAIGRLLSWVWPRFALDTGIPEDAGSHDPAVLAAYASDPLRHTRGTARLVTEFRRTSAWVRCHGQWLSTPTLILQGTADPVALPQGTVEFYRNLATSDKTYREYVDAYHDLHNDTCAAEMAADIIDWLDGHTTDKRIASILSCQVI